MVIVGTALSITTAWISTPGSVSVPVAVVGVTTLAIGLLVKRWPVLSVTVARRA